jgi:integrase
MIGLYIKSGSPRTANYVDITEEDKDKIQAYFIEHSDKDSNVLQDEILFNLLYFFQLRGRGNLRSLKRDTFKIGASDGKEYLYLNTTMISKNVKASLSSKEYEDLKKAKMFASDCDCPLSKYKTYLDLLPANTKENTLFPLISKKGFVSSVAVVGKDKLGNLMKRLSERCGLSRKYTNHCIRVAGINVLHKSGFNDKEISTITGHKNTASVQRYVRTSDETIEKASEVLSHGRKRKIEPPDSLSCPVDQYDTIDSSNYSTSVTKRIQTSVQNTNMQHEIQELHANTKSDLNSLFGSGNYITIQNLNVYQSTSN